MIFVAGLLFCLPGLLVFGLVLEKPEFVYSVMSADSVNNLEAMYDPKIKNLPVRELMTKDVLTLEPHDALTKAADMMVLQRIRRIPIVEGGTVVGVVSRHDLMRHTISAGGMLASQPA